MKKVLDFLETIAAIFLLACYLLFQLVSDSLHLCVRFIKSIFIPLRLSMSKLFKWFKERKLRKAIRKANRLHKLYNKKYYVFRVGKKFAIVNNEDIKLNKKLINLPKSLNAFELMKRCNYQTK